jgi:hypothetical protein
MGLRLSVELDYTGDGGLEVADTVSREGSSGLARASLGAVGRKRLAARLWISQSSTGDALKEEVVFPVTSCGDEATIGIRLRNDEQNHRRQELAHALDNTHTDENRMS